ncbi:MAG: hypothetical protein AABX38_03080 [Candidatus Micrarchaeota archaeon]
MNKKKRKYETKIQTRIAKLAQKIKKIASSTEIIGKGVENTLVKLQHKHKTRS